MSMARSLAVSADLAVSPRDPARIAVWATPFLLTLYLALNNGGYDLTERSEVGIALWWLILVAAATGLIGAPSKGAARTGLLLLLALVGWTVVSLSWTGSEERTMIEVGRVATYLAVLAIAVAPSANTRWRAALGGVTAAAALVVGLAAASRMLPGAFPEQSVEELLPGVELGRRLAYPLNYSSGLATFAALTVPLLIRAASSARLIALQAASAGVVPLAVLVLWLTGSSLAVPLLIVALGAYLALAPDRLPKLFTVMTCGLGSALLISAAAQRDALDRGLDNAVARGQGEELLAIAIVVAVGVAFLQAAVGLAARHGNPPWSAVPRRRASLVTGAVAALAVAVFALSPGPAAVGDAWREFKDPTAGLDPNEASRSSQLLDVSSRGRYDFWRSAVDAFETEPVRGIGPGTFEFWWAREKGDFNRTIFVRDAHSLYIESMAELGIVGLLLVVAFVLLVLVAGAIRALRALPARRDAIAACTAGAAVFAAAAAVDWVWELGVLGVIFFLLAAIALSARDDAEEPARARSWTRPALALLAAGGVAAVAIPMGGAVAVDRSRDAAAENRASDALDAAADGRALQPYAAGPELQLALLLEERGQYEAAASAAAKAAENEPKDWRNWITLSRLEARAGNAEEALAAYTRARALNPSSPLFDR